MDNNPIFDYDFMVGQYALFHAAEFDVHVRVTDIIWDINKSYLIQGPRDQMIEAGFEPDSASSDDRWLVCLADPDELSPAAPLRPKLIAG